MGVTRSPGMVGRNAEMSVLESALGGARSGRGGLVALTGEAGIGKSRLAAELTAQAIADGALVITGRAVPSATGVAYRPLTEAMLQALRSRPLPDDPDLAPWLPALRAIVPELGVVAESRGESTPVARSEAVIRLLRLLGGVDGVVMVLEDLHWADPDTLAVVDYLAGNLMNERILCVVTTRSQAPSNVLDVVERLRGRPGVVLVTLERLDDEQVARMVRACVPGASDQLVSRVQQSAEGIPLLVEDLLASPGVPQSFADTVTARIGQLDRDERAVLEAAALFGRRFDWELLPPSTGLGQSVIVVALGRAVECQLLIVEDDQFRFRHALTRDAVLAATLPPRRAELAGRCLVAVEALDPQLGGAWRDVAADLAAYAGDRARAAHLLVASGREALERGALATAIETLHRAIGLVPEGGEVIIEAEWSLLEALALAGRVDEAIAVGTVLIRRVSDGTPSDAAHVHVRLAHAAVSGTRWPVVIEHLDAASALLTAGEHPELDCRIAVLRAEAALAVNDVERAWGLASTVLSEPSAGPEARCQSHEVLGRVERLKDPGAAGRHFGRALSVAEESGLTFWRLRALHELGTIELFDHCGTDRLHEARQTAVTLGALSTVAVLDLQLSAAYSCLFSLDAGLESAEESLELAERLGLDQVRTKALVFLAENHAHRRQRDEMEHYLLLALSSSPDPAVEGFAWGARGMLAFLEDDRSGALDALGRSTAILARLPHAEPANFRGLWPVVLGAAGDRRAGAALEEARRLGIDRFFAHRGMLGYAEAILIGRRREAERATALAVAADPELATAGVWGHFTRLCAAETALIDHWGYPRSWLESARVVFDNLGLASLADRCGRLLGSAKGGDWMRLGITAREGDVLELVAAGMTNKAIAARLKLSPRTVEKHVESLMRKTGSRSRTQLAVMTAVSGEG